MENQQNDLNSLMNTCEEFMETGILQTKTEEIQRACAVWISKVVFNQWNRVLLVSK